MSQYPVQITLLIDTDDPKLADTAAEQLEFDDMSTSSNFTGATSIAIFIIVALPTIVPIVKSILAFVVAQQTRYQNASLSIDGKKLSLKGYSPDDVEKILALPIFEKFSSK